MIELKFTCWRPCPGVTAAIGRDAFVSNSLWLLKGSAIFIIAENWAALYMDVRLGRKDYRLLTLICYWKIH